MDWDQAASSLESQADSLTLQFRSFILPPGMGSSWAMLALRASMILTTFCGCGVSMIGRPAAFTDHLAGEAQVGAGQSVDARLCTLTNDMESRFQAVNRFVVEPGCRDTTDRTGGRVKEGKSGATHPCPSHDNSKPAISSLFFSIIIMWPLRPRQLYSSHSEATRPFRARSRRGLPGSMLPVRG